MAKRLAERPHAIGDGSGGRLGFVCHMWFDVWPTFYRAKDIPDWREAMWTALRTLLKVPHRDVQVSALHGIGHNVRYLQRQNEIDRAVAGFIATHENDFELVQYARVAASGMVQ